MAVDTSNLTPPDDAKRRLIREALDTTLLVEAAAGTGKTTSMVGRMVELIAEGACDIGAMAAVTFTRKATAELRDRFGVALERGARADSGTRRERLAEGLARVEQCFIGTIHSFCARLLRERPVEAGVDVAFQEIDEHEEARLRDDAWNDYVARMLAASDPQLDELDELGLSLEDLRRAYFGFAEYPDVERWPAPEIQVDEALAERARKELRRYVRHMQELAPTLPAHPGNDKLIPMYRELTRRLRHARIARLPELMGVLERCLTVDNVVQKEWPGGKSQAIAERERWLEFQAQYATPLVEQWRRRRYGPALRVLQGAADRYTRLRAERGVLSYQDLLMKAAGLLRDQPHVRAYFRGRFSHLLVDEFQDTDPVQAEVMLLLTADDDEQTRWRECRPRPGSLFVVGDPKQSIYRFRRADIVTYNEVRGIIEAHGRVVALTANFRSTEPIITWINGVSAKLFPEQADAFAPADRRMDAMRAGCPAAECRGVLALDAPSGVVKGRALLEHEADVIARTIRDALDRGLRVPRGGGGAPTAVTPSDFLVLTRRRDPLIGLADRLQQFGIPVEVTGGSSVNDVDEVMLLQVALRTLVESDNPVALVGLLRSACFGISDDELYRYARGGGAFQLWATHEKNEQIKGTERILAALEHLQEWAGWLRTMPPVAAIERIAVASGLYGRAAAAPDGRDRAGALGKAIELLRAAASEQWTPAGLVDYLARLTDPRPIEKHDGVPLRPHAQAVRIMNLHQAKGLEAPIVFLADGGARTKHEPDLFIDRRGGQSAGYFALRGKGPAYRSGPLLALPDDWEAHCEQERQFLEAEQQRLLYVAATRAGAQLVISRPAKSRGWGALADSVPAGAELPDPPALEPAPEVGAPLPDGAVAAFEETLAARWTRVLKPTYGVRRAKELAVRGGHRANTAGEHGTEWGMVVHQLLEAAMLRPGADLTPLAEAALREHELDPARAADALELVRRVTDAPLWTRARGGTACLTEVPLQYVETIDDLPTLVRGVIDLVFQEGSEGDRAWVIVDYKTDDRPGEDVDVLVEHYAPQVRAYATAWRRMVGQPVIEAGLFFVRTGTYRTVTDAAGAPIPG